MRGSDLTPAPTPEAGRKRRGPLRTRPWRNPAVLLAGGLFLAACGSTTAATGGSSGSSGSTQSTMAHSATVMTASNPSLGTILVDSSGMTLYRFDQDTGGKSTCTGSCATLWPPLLVPAGQSTPVGASGVTGLGTTTRSDGGVQVTYQGSPLYRYSPDQAPGQTKGNGIGGVWHVVTVTATSGTSGASSSGPGTTGSSGSGGSSGGYGGY